MADWDYSTDVVVVGSGGGLCGAVTAAANGLEALVIERARWSAGRPPCQAVCCGCRTIRSWPRRVPDSLEEGLTYFDSVVGDIGPASSPARRRAYIEEGANMVHFLR